MADSSVFKLQIMASDHMVYDGDAVSVVLPTTEGMEGILAHHINFGVLEDDCSRQSFMRGAFFAGGSVTDPNKRYHLELVTDHYNVSREAFSLLLDMGFEPKSTSRGGNYITYFKNSEIIADFLTTLGAPVAAIEIMSAKIMKENLIY